MANKSQGILLCALVVALLVIVVARLDPGEARDPQLPKETRFVMVLDTPEPESEEVTPTPEPEPEAQTIRNRLPGVSPSDWNLRLVNSAYALTANYPVNLAETRDGEKVDSRIAEDLEAMLSAADAAGYTVCIRSGYVSYQTQAYLFYGRASIISEGQGVEYAEAEEMARSLVPYPGTSEHQTGLAVDLMDSAATVMTESAAEKLRVLAWLREHCAEYGFIYRYPEEKRDLTGWYVPWHFRYVGKTCAQYMVENDLCLEEFIALF